RLAERLLATIHRLKPADRQVMLLYLEDLTAAEIGEVTGLSPGAVSVRIHRLKTLLTQAHSAEETHPWLSIPNVPGKTPWRLPRPRRWPTCASPPTSSTARCGVAT